MREIYICSKPLQCFNIFNIPHRDNIERRILVVVDKFNESQHFVESLRKHNTQWDKICYFKTDNRALLYVFFSKVDNLYINYDISILLAVLYYLKRLNIYTYEEGIGSYCKLKRWSKGFFSIIRKILGVGMINNSSTFIKGTYLYRPDIFKKMRPESLLPLFNMKKDFCSSLLNNGIPWPEIYKKDIEYFSNIKDLKVLFYVTTWNVNEEILSKIAEEKDNYNLIIIKPHPAIYKSEYNFPNYATIVKSPILVEILLSILIQNKNAVTVFHESSTAVVYFEDAVKTINYQETTFYRDFVNNI